MDDPSESRWYVVLSLVVGIPLSILTTWWLIQHGMPWWAFFLMR